MTAIVISLIIVTQSSHDASNLDQMSHTHTEKIFVTFWYLWASCRQVFDRGLLQWCVLVNQSVEVDCEDHVHVPPVKFLELCDSNKSAASLTLHENDAVHVKLTSGTSSSNREEERPPEPIAGFGSRAGTTNQSEMHRVWVASFADIYQPGV